MPLAGPGCTGDFACKRIRTRAASRLGLTYCSGASGWARVKRGFIFPILSLAGANRSLYSTGAVMTLPRQTLRSTAYDLADALDVNEVYQQKGWTDGLPIVPPTEERVVECLQAVGLAAAAIVGVEPIRQRPITAEKVAINAVMAGCLPAYMPVVVAILRAMCQEPFNLHGSTASTGGSAPFIVVNGPIRTAIGMNATHNVLGNGNRANATIG